MARSDTNIGGGCSETCQQTSRLDLFLTRGIKTSGPQVMFCAFENAYLHGRVTSKQPSLFLLVVEYRHNWQDKHGVTQRRLLCCFGNSGFSLRLSLSISLSLSPLSLARYTSSQRRCLTKQRDKLDKSKDHVQREWREKKAAELAVIFFGTPIENNKKRQRSQDSPSTWICICRPKNKERIFFFSVVVGAAAHIVVFPPSVSLSLSFTRLAAVISIDYD